MEWGVPQIQYDRCPWKRGGTETQTHRDVNTDTWKTPCDGRLEQSICELRNTKAGQQYWKQYGKLRERPGTFFWGGFRASTAQPALLSQDFWPP